MTTQLDLFTALTSTSQAPIVTSQPRPISAWRQVIDQAREQSTKRYPLGLLHRPFGGLYDRITSPEGSLPAAHDDWPHLWFVYCPTEPHAASSATLTSGYQDRRSA